MFERFQAHLKASALIAPGSQVLVGYSGGADSTCLLHMLHRSGAQIVAAHLHHGQRAEADLEQKLCRAFCEEIGVPFVSGKANVPKMARELGMGLEEAGRHARYDFFARAALSAGCSQIATAHTRTDLVETVLMNMARGAGLAGLAGIPERRENIIRPLLIFGRDDTKSYCETHGLWTHEDPANMDFSFARARIRHRLLRELHALNPRFEEAIQRLSEIAGEEDRFLNGMAAAALEQAEVPLNGDLRFLTIDVEACFDRAKLLALPPVLFKRAMRLLAGALGATLDYDQVQPLLGSASQDNGSVTTEGGAVAIEWNESHVHARQLHPCEPFRFPLTVPGETVSEEFGWSFTASPTTETPTVVRCSLNVAIDLAQTKGPLYFRTVQPGDLMRPLGFSGRRKLSDILSEAKLTQAARARLPIVCDMLGPLWAPGVCLDERARPDHGKCVLLSFGARRP